MKIKNLIFSLMVFFFTVSVYSNSLRHLKKEIFQTSEKLITVYVQNKQILLKQNIAIVDFQNQGKLAKKYDVATTVQDLFTTQFVNSTVFNVVERKNLHKILKEKELQMTGLTEDSANQIRTLLNADALLIGSVTEIGQQFQISVKLVNVATGQISAAQTFSISKSEMINSAKELEMEYVQKMSVGINVNFLSSTAIGENATLNLNQFSDAEFSSTYLNRSVGVEVKYRFTKNVMLGLGMNMLDGQVYYNPNLEWSCPPNVVLNTNGHGPFHIVTKGSSIPLSLYLVFNPSLKLNFFISGGVEYAMLKYSGFFQNEEGGGAGFGINDYGPELSNDMIIFIARTGIEFFLTKRLAVSLKIGYDFANTTLDTKPLWHLPQLAQNNLEIDFSGFFIQPAISFYF